MLQPGFSRTLVTQSRAASAPRTDDVRPRAPRLHGPRALTCGLLVALLLPLAFPSPPAAAQSAPTVRSIELRGLSRISEGEVRAQLRIAVGDPYDPALLDEEYQRLFQTGQYRFIEPRVERVENGVKIVLTFFERKLVRDIKLRGVESLDRVTILDGRRTRNGKLLDETDLGHDQADLERLYREKGFLFATVSTSVTPHPRKVSPEDAERFRQQGRTVTTNSEGQAYVVDGVRVTFQAVEGPQVSVASIRFEGNENYGDSELRSVISTRARSAFFGFPNSGYFEEDVFLQDLARVEAFYRSHGYFDVHVAAEDFSFNRDRTELHLRVRVEEGERYRVSRVDIAIDGPGVFAESIIRDRFSIQEGDFWDGEALQRDQAEVLRLYRD
ncbi:MAG: POTRA domain-containing protein, partial [Planctomycetota bacterium]